MFEVEIMTSKCISNARYLYSDSTIYSRRTDNESHCIFIWKAGVLALIDSGDAGSFINQEFVINNNIQTQELKAPITAYNINRTVNKHSRITHYLDMVLDFGNHKESVRLYVSGFGKQKIILGFPWLKESNPTISWSNSTIE